MSCHSRTQSGQCIPHSDNHTHIKRPLWQRAWMIWTGLAGGLVALAWLLLRTGTKPSRITYPCQQVACSAAALAFGSPLTAVLIAGRHRVLAVLRTPTGIALAVLSLLVATGFVGYFSRAAAYLGPTISPRQDYVAEIYHVVDCPEDPAQDRFAGVDALLRLMGRQGLKIYRSPHPSLLAGPDGIIAADDIVVIKINYQWAQRGGTNTDVLRGLIRRLVDHPDTFAGEVVVCENAQFASVQNFDRSQNNAQDRSLSPHDVVVGFQNQGYNVSHYDWTVRRSTQVGEYSDGDMTDGYIVYPYDAPLRGRVSYPKFRSSGGAYISLRYGLWDADSQTYDREHLKFINLPVLKSHHSTYGVTACVKDYMGVVTGQLSTNSHTAIGYGILGALLGEIQLADLNILDCIWINANPYSGPATSYAGATRRNELVASVDPVAADIWAAKHILIPAFIANGHAPPWPYPSADPDDPNSAFRRYLDNSMNWILAAGYDVTNDFDQIETATAQFGDLNCDLQVDAFDIEPFLLALFEPIEYPNQYPDCDIILADMNGDGVVNAFDIEPFLELLFP